MAALLLALAFVLTADRLTDQPKSAVYSPSTGDGAHRYTVTLRNLDFHSGLLAVRVVALGPKGNPPQRVTLQFETIYAHRRFLWSRPVAGMSTTHGVALSFAEVPPDRVGAYPEVADASGDSVVYAAETVHSPLLEPRKFPFDYLLLGFRLYTDSQPGLPPPPASFSVVNELKDFRMHDRTDSEKPDLIIETELEGIHGVAADHVDVMLDRDLFLRLLAVTLFFVGLGSSLLIIRGSIQGRSELSLLTLFTGLWGARQLLLNPLHDYKPFPAIPDLAAVFLFLFTLLGIALLRLLSGLSGAPAQVAASARRRLAASRLWVRRQSGRS